MASTHFLVCLHPKLANYLETNARAAMNSLRKGYDRHEITSGRYTQHFLLRDPQTHTDPRVIQEDGTDAGRCAGGPIGLLDLTAMRDHAAAKAAEVYDAWAVATADMPPARPWAQYVEDSGDSFRNLQSFRAQPQVKIMASIMDPRRVQRSEEAALVALDRDAFIARARLRAVPGDRLRTVDKKWTVDPAFLNDDDAIETGSTAYYQHVNDYLDQLAPDYLLVGGDGHR